MSAGVHGGPEGCSEPEMHEVAASLTQHKVYSFLPLFLPPPPLPSSLSSLRNILFKYCKMFKDLV